MSTISDAQQLMSTFVPVIKPAVARIAPENAQIVPNGWTLEFGDGRANFEAFPTERKIAVQYAALLSLWATSAAAMRFAHLMVEARRRNALAIPTDPGTPGHAAMAYRHAATALVRDHRYGWKLDLPWPTFPPPDKEQYAFNNVFLGATAWVLHHEIAHIVHKHEIDTIPDIRRRQEVDADEWATKMVMENVPDPQHRQFRAVAVTTALIWNGLVEEVRGPDHHHPSAPHRLSACAQHFGLGDDDPANEMCAYALKALFDPSTFLPVNETGQDALEQMLVRYRAIASEV